MFENQHPRFLVALALLPFGGCVLGLGGIRGSGNLVALEKEFADFTEINVGHGCKLRVTPSETFSVVLRIDDNLAQYLKVEQKGSALSIGMRFGHNYRNLHLEADIGLPDIEALRMSGGARGTLTGFNLGHGMSVNLSGGSRLSGTLMATRLNAAASGGSDMKLEGSSSGVDVDGSGGSILRLSNWETDDLSVGLSGGSSCSIKVNDSIRGSLSGGSKVSYEGHPSVDVSKSGGSRVVGS
ncbi:MAG: head GIN domain-containing protein [Acidobacteriota bacterium]